MISKLCFQERPTVAIRWLFYSWFKLSANSLYHQNIFWNIWFIIVFHVLLHLPHTLMWRNLKLLSRAKMKQVRACLDIYIFKAAFACFCFFWSSCFFIDGGSIFLLLPELLHFPADPGLSLSLFRSSLLKCLCEVVLGITW